MSAVLHRSLVKTYPQADSGDQVYLIASDGTRVLDGCGGAAVSCLGHNNQEVIDAIVWQAQSMAFAHTSFFTNTAAEDLASLLTKHSDSAFSKAIFLSSGSEAVETAIKLARQYHLCNGHPDRVHYIGRRESYHGNTLGALAAGGNTERRAGFTPLLAPVFHHVSPYFYHRDATDGESVTQYTDRLITEFDEKFQSLGSSKVAAVIVEPVVGATLGSVPASEGYLSRLRHLCHDYGALLIFDEVMCGMGRVGTLHAWQSLGGCSPDIQTIGKGLAAGYQPLSGVLISNSICNKLQEMSEKHPFQSGHTYQGHAIACAAGLATQRYLIQHDLLSNVQEMGVYMGQLLREKLPRIAVKDIRGLGLFQTVEFASSALGAGIAKDVSTIAFEKGLAVYLCSAVDGVILAPPYTIKKTQVHALLEVFVAAVLEVYERHGMVLEVRN